SDAIAIHPVAQAFPVPDAEVRARMREDIKARGIDTPIVLNKAKNQIIDGVTRWRIATELGLRFRQVPIEVFIGKDEDIPSFIIAKTAWRRHLSKGEALKLADAILKQKAAQKADEGKSDLAENERSLKKGAKKRSVGGKGGGSTKDPRKAALK